MNWKFPEGQKVKVISKSLETIHNKEVNIRKHHTFNCPPVPGYEVLVDGRSWFLYENELKELG